MTKIPSQNQDKEQETNAVDLIRLGANVGLDETAALILSSNQATDSVEAYDHAIRISEAIKEIVSSQLIRSNDIRVIDNEVIIKHNNNQPYIIDKLKESGALNEDNYSALAHLDAIKNIVPTQSQGFH
jgi:hypothetical protein